MTPALDESLIIDVREHYPGGALTVDDAGLIVFANPAIARMLEAEPQALLGKKFDRLLTPASRVFHSTQVFPLLRLKGTVSEVYFQLRAPSGAEVDVLFSAKRTVKQGAGLSHCALMGMGQRKQLEVSLVEARRAAEAATAAKDQFLAVISHELRSPLSAIMGWARIGQSEKLTDEMRIQAFQTIDRNAAVQARLIDDLLDVSRIVSGKLRISPRALELAPLIESAVDTARPAAQAKGITLLLSLDRSSNVVYADPDRFQQIAWNLLTNAIKFTPKGGRIQITLLRVESHVQFGVSDTGTGIEIDQLPHVFDRFWQADAKTGISAGLGLGLSICKSLVELHGGLISANSQGPGCGTTFSVELPLAVSSSRQLRTSGLSPELLDERPLATSLRGIDILVVDDDHDTRELMAVLFATAGARVVVTESCSEALDALREAVPDIVLSDIGLQDADGYELIRLIRSGTVLAARAVPAVAITGMTRPQDRVAALRAGFQAYLSKPVDPAELMALVRSLTLKL